MSTRKLLLADDSITIQKVVNLTFADEGIEVITVSDGDSAMEKLAETSPDLVMADVNMPGLNGYQVCERIKQDTNLRQTPVILLVGSFEPFDEEEARRVGADDFLTKPFQSIRQLVSKVTALLDSNDRSAAQLYDSTANNSFADTLDMEKSETINAEESAELGNAGMDDEMIQVNQVNSFALDESAKFETREVSEPSEDLAKTQPLSVYDLKEFSFVAASDNTAENQPESEASDETSFTENSVHEETSPSFLNSNNGDDLLEIPFDEEDEWNQEEETLQPAIVEAVEEAQTIEERDEITSETIPVQELDESQEEYRSENEIVVGTLIEPEIEEEKIEETTKNQTTSEISTQFSPELIDAVAQRVIEKLSDKAVREIAWEVVPQHADLIIRKMVEEKLKDSQ